MPYESRRNKQNNGNINNTNNAVGSRAKDNINLSSLENKERNNKEHASAKALETAAKGAGTYFGGPLGKKAVDAASKSKVGKDLLNKGGQVLNKIPNIEKATRKLGDEGFANKINSVADGSRNKLDNEVNNEISDGGESIEKSLPSSVSINSSSDNESINGNGNGNDRPKIAGIGPFAKNDYSKEALEEKKEQENAGDKAATFLGKFTASFAMKMVLFLSPIIILIVIIASIISSLIGGVGDFVDGLGAMFASGGETGDVEFQASEDAEAFYERINDVKLSYQAEGKSVDALKIAAVYRVLFSDKAKLNYDDMTEEKIKDIADCMFSGNTYDEDVFKQNLLNHLIPKYYPKSTNGEREEIVDDIFEYIDNYYSLVGKETTTACANIGSCIYDIKGFYIPGSGNVSKNMKISNLMVRLMECGGAYGNGSDTKPIDQPLVPFEDYVMGVAYAEVGTSYPDEAIKAQMVVARSYALARPTAMGNANGKKLAEENGQWVLQIASCVSDQVFCNVDEGCSYMGGGDGQGGIVRSGIVSGAERTRPALDQNHRLRTLASEVQGEVLVNNQGYIIGSGFLSTEQNEFKRLADSGLNYKQIIMQVYNSGNRNYGASNIDKVNCNNGDSSCSGSSSTGPFASWKQYSGPWTSVPLGSSNETIQSAGCLVTSVAMLIAKSGVETNISDFNPGTFVEQLNNNGGFSGANFVWASASNVAPRFNYQGKVNVAGQSRKEKLNKLKGLLESGYYVVAEVKGDTGQHWVAIDGISGDSILMMDPGSEATDMWSEYSWKNTSQFSYYAVN